MQLMSEVMVPARDIGRFGALLGEKALVEVRAAARTVLERLAGGAIWNVNSTAVGGGSPRCCTRSSATAAGWASTHGGVVIAAATRFFTVTKRIHHHLHGERGDGGPLGNEQRRLYEDTLRADSVELAARIRPTTSSSARSADRGHGAAMMRAGAKVVWRCHIGHDKRGPEIERGWAFLRPYLAEVPRVIFSRRSYVPAFLAGDRAAIIPPSIDALLAHRTRTSPTTRCGRSSSRSASSRGAAARARDPSSLAATARPVVSSAPSTSSASAARPPGGRRVVVQVSRWDPLKDMVGCCAASP
jgi:trehalose synthase